jgi:hypothetical protein
MNKPDREPVDKLIRALLDAIRAHYAAVPIDRGRIYEALNAQAVVLVVTLAGLSEDAIPDGLDFYHQAFEEHFKEIRRVKQIFELQKGRGQPPPHPPPGG